MNSHFLGEKIRYFNKVHLGLAVDTDRGLMVPVVRNADDLSLPPGLSLQLKEVASACRGGSVNPDILASESGTFTVSNLGNYGGRDVYTGYQPASVRHSWSQYHRPPPS